MRIIVTGGSGFIGSHVVRKLKQKHKVLVIDKKRNPECESKIIDILNYPKLGAAFKSFKPEIVIHLAAQVELRKSLKDPVFDAQTNILGTINVLRACEGLKIKKFIYTGTGGARYGTPERLPAKEHDRVSPESPYGTSKMAAEHYVRVLGELYGFDYLMLCFGNVYGPGDNPEMGRVISVFISSIIKGKSPSVFGDGEQTRDYLYVEDIAEVITKNLTTKTNHKLFNLASGTQTSVNEIYEIIEKELNSGLKPKYISAIKGEVRDILLDISLAKKELKFKPTPLKIGMKKTISWFKETRD